MQARVSTRQTSASREPSQYFRVTMFTDMEETEAPPPGSNRLCSHSTSRHRFRKEWRSLSAQEREVFVSTLELSITQQKIQSIVRYHTYPRSSFQSHTTCGFILWHRSFLLAVEDMLRDLAPPRTSCLTIPYWDVTVDYHRQNTMGSCFSMASCAPGLFLELMGGSTRLLSKREQYQLHQPNGGKDHRRILFCQRCSYRRSPRFPTCRRGW